MPETSVRTDEAMMEQGYRFKLIPRAGGEPLYAKEVESVEDMVRNEAFDVVTLDGTFQILVGGSHEETTPEAEHVQVTSYRPVFPQSAHRSGIEWDYVKHFGPIEVALRQVGEEGTKGIYEYALWDHEWPTEEVFHGHDFLASLSQSDDAKAVGLLGLLSRRREDADEGYFVHYMPDQLEWRDRRAEVAQEHQFRAKERLKKSRR